MQLNAKDQLPDSGNIGDATLVRLSVNTLLKDSDAEILQLSVGPMDNNVYVIRCTQTGDAILIDAANEHERLLELCTALGIRKVLETHGHWDHVQAVPAVREAGIDVGITRDDSALLSSYDFVIDDEEVTEVGRLRLKSVITPGHTPGSVCFKLEGLPILFSGDTLFPGGPGNTSFEGGNFETIMKSLEERLFVFPDDTIILPGHGSSTTLGKERPHLAEWHERGW